MKCKNVPRVISLNRTPLLHRAWFHVAQLVALNVKVAVKMQLYCRAISSGWSLLRNVLRDAVAKPEQAPVRIWLADQRANC